MRATIKQISKLADVSEGTVDRVIHNRGKVRPETREKIERIIRELDYKPNLLARNLALDSTFNIAVIIPHCGQDGGYWRLIKSGIDKAAENLQHFGLKVNVCTFDKFSKDSFNSTLNNSLNANYDGIILAPIYLNESRKYLKRLNGNIPYVLVDTDLPGSACLTSIHQSSYHGGQVAAQLMGMVIQRPAAVLLVRFLPGTLHIDERLRGFKDFLSEREDIKLISADIPQNSSRTDINKILKNLFTANKSLKGIFVPSSHTYEVAKYIGPLNDSGKRYLIGFDLIPDNIKFMRDGVIDFLIAQKPEQQGYAGIYSLYRRLVVREDVDREITIPIEIITKENLKFHDSNASGNINQTAFAGSFY